MFGENSLVPQEKLDAIFFFSRQRAVFEPLFDRQAPILRTLKCKKDAFFTRRARTDSRSHWFPSPLCKNSSSFFPKFPERPFYRNKFLSSPTMEKPTSSPAAKNMLFLKKGRAYTPSPLSRTEQRGLGVASLAARSDRRSLQSDCTHRRPVCRRPVPPFSLVGPPFPPAARIASFISRPRFCANPAATSPPSSERHSKMPRRPRDVWVLDCSKAPPFCTCVLTACTTASVEAPRWSRVLRTRRRLVTVWLSSFPRSEVQDPPLSWKTL